jgi:hypothetical protein
MLFQPRYFCDIPPFDNNRKLHIDFNRIGGDNDREEIIHVDVDTSALAFMYCVSVGSDTDVSGVHANPNYQRRNRQFRQVYTDISYGIFGLNFVLKTQKFGGMY